MCYGLAGTGLKKTIVLEGTEVLTVISAGSGSN